MRWIIAFAGVVSATLAAVSCADDAGAPPPPPPASKETLLDSKFCGGCHREHYEEWSGSMHAYAADDPLFRALNARMQREVPPEQQGFCLNCHAPMLTRLGYPADLAVLDRKPELKGVSCYFCHAMTAVNGRNNNPLELGDPPVMGGPIRDPVDPQVHKAEYRTWLDSTQDNQAGMCGPCHDIATVGGAHIERTFDEWTKSSFGVGGQTKTSCANCHMPARDGRAAATANAPPRKIHDHAMPGVDLSLIPFPGQDVQRGKVQALLDDAVDARLCVVPEAGGLGLDVALKTGNVGHSFPSGSVQDRRSWIELTAFTGDTVVFESGHVPQGTAVSRFGEPNLFVLRDYDLDESGAETELFWRAKTFNSNQLPPPPRTSVHVKYTVPASSDRIEMVLKIRGVDTDLLETLADDLDRSKLAPLPTLALAKTHLIWTAGAGPCVP